jgi:hypothetical protein
VSSDPGVTRCVLGEDRLVVVLLSGRVEDHSLDRIHDEPVSSSAPLRTSTLRSAEIPLERDPSRRLTLIAAILSPLRVVAESIQAEQSAAVARSPDRARRAPWADLLRRASLRCRRPGVTTIAAPTRIGSMSGTRRRRRSWLYGSYARS